MAISVLGAGAVLQLGAVCWAFAVRLRAQPMASVEEGAPLLAKLNPDLNADPFADVAAGSVAPKPTPVPVNSQGADEAPPANRFEEAVAQGKALRDRGDTNTALTRFREAGAINPQSPIPIKELAETFEKMGLMEKAGENWRRIYDMGDAAGIYFSLAEAKLRVAMKQAVDGNSSSSSPAPATVSPDMAEIDGIATGMTLGLLPISMEEVADNASATHFTLKIPIKARPNSKVDAHELTIGVNLYDILNGQQVVRTSAKVSSRWLTTPADWVEADVEDLSVEYRLPRPDPRSRESRKYFGYIVNIYYKGQLQATTSDPARLGQQFPAPPILSKEPEK